MLQLSVIKKDNSLENFDPNKIISAVEKAAFRCDRTIEPENLDRIVQEVLKRVSNQNHVSVSELHELVIATLSFLHYKEVAEAYAEYRYYKTTYAKTFEQLRQDADDVLRLGDRENANFDSSLVSTKGTLIKGYLTKSLYKQFYLSGNEKKLIERGDIYIHDLRDMILGCFNCCLFDIGNILKGGFEMSNVQYTEPKTALSALQVIGDITLVATAQQFGGFTLPELDKVLLPYVLKSLKASTNRYVEMGIEEELAHEIAYKDVVRELEQGFQSLELKLNTVPCSRGDFAFTTITFGQWNKDKYSETERYWLSTIGSIMLQVRRKGHGKDGKPVVFPKLVYLYDKNQIESDLYSSMLFEDAVKTSSQCMYPDYLSLSSEYGSVSEIYQKYGAITSPMGCVLSEELVTYMHDGLLYVESIKRMWDRMSKHFPVLVQPNGKDHYIEPTGLQIYDTVKGFVTVTRLNRNTQKDWVNLKVSNGRYLTCTTDHPLPTLNRGRVLAGDLQVGDKLALGNKQFVKEDTNINVDLAWWLGVMICDGCYQNHNVTLSLNATGEDDIKDRFVANTKSIFGYDVNVKLQDRRSSKKGYYQDIRIVSDNNGNLAYLMNYLTEQFGGVNKKDRQIPQSIFRADRSTRVAFLAGMIDADGYVNNSKKKRYPTLGLGSTNRELALQQMALLQSLGIYAKVYANHYSKKSDKVRFRVECYMTKELSDAIASQKKRNHGYIENCDLTYTQGKVREIERFEKEQYCYDVTTESDHFEVSGIYSHNCRAFLSLWQNEKGEAITVGRCNIGAVSLNLPIILTLAQKNNPDDWENEFWKSLDEKLEVIRAFFKKRYDIVRNQRCSSNPLAFTQGGLYEGNKNPDDIVGDMVRYMTASFGITALDETTYLWTGKRLVDEGGEVASKILRHLKEKLAQFKAEDGYLYAIYGTPAESLCATQAHQYDKLCKEIGVDNVFSHTEHYSTEYFTNSFHVNVTEAITPFEKQDKEFQDFHLCEGGHIQYVRLDNPENLEAVKAMIERGMEMGFYQGVNFDSAYCGNCGSNSTNVLFKCPKCGSDDLSVISRVCGYLGYSNVNGMSRMNDGKMAEIKNRVSM